MRIDLKLTNLIGVPVGECLHDPPANWYRVPQSGNQMVSVVNSPPITISSSISTSIFVDYSISN